MDKGYRPLMSLRLGGKMASLCLYMRTIRAVAYIVLISLCSLHQPPHQASSDTHLSGFLPWFQVLTTATCLYPSDFFKFIPVLSVTSLCLLRLSGLYCVLSHLGYLPFTSSGLETYERATRPSPCPSRSVTPLMKTMQKLRSPAYLSVTTA
jgi:hypothetical protein